MSDASRKLILARRARFVAAAMVGAGLGASEACTPQPCLEPPISTATSSSSAPQMCLSPIPSVTPAPPDAGALDAGPPPAVCLTRLR